MDTRRALILQACAALLPGMARAAPTPPQLIAGIVAGVNEPGGGIERRVSQLLEQGLGQGLDERLQPSWMPWTRAYATALNGNSLLFPLARTPERETAWRWLAPLAHDELVLVLPRRLARSQLGPLRVGVIRSTFMLARLQQLGFANLEPATSEMASARKLGLGRIDAWATLNSVARSPQHQVWLPPDAQILQLDGEPFSLWLAASPDLGFSLPSPPQAAPSQSMARGKSAAPPRTSAAQTAARHG